MGDPPSRGGWIASFVLLQVGWFACVLGAAHGWRWLGPVVVLATLGLHLWVRPPAARAAEGVVLVVAALAGFAVDTCLLRAEIFDAHSSGFSPLWLVALWPNTAAATASGTVLSALEKRWVVAAIVGGVAGAMAYEAGARLGAIELSDDRVSALLTIAVAWSVVLPGLFWLRSRLFSSR